MAAPAAASRLAFVPAVPAPDVGFWRELTKRKLEVQRLDSSPMPIWGYYEAPGTADSQPKCFLLGESFDAEPRLPAGAVLVRGEIQNFNTVEEFKAFITSGGAAARVATTLGALRDNIASGRALQDPALLRPLHVVAFADLKKHHFAYTVSLPVLTPQPSWSSYAPSCGAEEAGFSREQLCALWERLREDSALAAAGAFLLVRGSGSPGWDIRRLGDLASCADVAKEDLAVVFIDPTGSGDAAGWPLRNLAMALAYLSPRQYRVLAFRDPHLASRSSDVAVRSRVFFLQVSRAQTEALASRPLAAEVQYAGWSKIQNFDLTAFLDKRRMAADAVDLNIKLMKWRLVPELEPERMKALRFLLLGAGTLGCSLARALMGWGVRRMTLVDSGKVAFSNPVRQSLFTHRDAAEGRPKALAAREAVEAVMPDAEVEAIELDIPMPGHPHQSPEALSGSIERLQELVASHDVVCMLTDSRESRWLPSLLVAAAQSSGAEGAEEKRPPPLGLTVALGFDSFLVSRQTYMDVPAACYFCNDVTAPADSLTFRTLDQQCTVTRPGLSGLAASTAVELVAALVQHRDGFRAPGEPTASSTASPLGAVPHQIRGYLSDFRLAPTDTEPFRHCICCSPAVLSRYAEEGSAFVKRIIANSAELEEISGLADMKAGVREADILSFDEFEEAAD